MDIHVHLTGPIHIHTDSAKLDALSALVTQQGARIMATLDELVQANKELKAKVGEFPGIIDAMEARVTDAIKNAPLSAADQAKVDEAFADAREALGTGTAAAADAADGVDEAAATATPPAEPPAEPTP